MELVTTTFEKTAPLSEALALVHSSDVIIGMHGAGLTNLLGMHKVSLSAHTVSVTGHVCLGHHVCSV